jgi:hypothetical protein
MSKAQVSVRQVRRLWMTFALLTISVLLGPAQAQHTKMTPVLNDYFKMVFAGDVQGAAELFSSDPEDHGSKMLSDGFSRRFVDRRDSLDLSSVDSPAVRTIAEMFQNYWRDALMQVAPLEQLEAELKHELDAMLTEHGFSSALDDEDILLENVEAFIRQEGYFALSGRTPPLLELMMWTKNDVATELVELTDDTYEVEVNYLDDFVSYGWSNFATFGMTSTGGWAKKDGLYCLCSHYDLESERFRLSFLKHEARHFADFQLYPELQASDLEYRGKLTELAFSETEIFGLLTHFFNSANRIDNAPHPLANWYVIDGLSKNLLDGEWPADAKAWEAVPKEAIRMAARRLLDEHDATLVDLGAGIATGVINF